MSLFRRREPPRWGIQATFILGTLSLVFGAVTAASTARFAARAETADATVLHVDVVRGGRTPGYAPSFRFTSKAGLEYLVRGKAEGSPDDVKVGQRVKVLYDPAHPGDARLDTFSLWRPVVWMIGIGLFLLGTSWLRLRRPAERRPG